jgi:tetratricopeptide (TPR) repeat protein
VVDPHYGEEVYGILEKRYADILEEFRVSHPSWVDWAENQTRHFSILKSDLLVARGQLDKALRHIEELLGHSRASFHGSEGFQARANILARMGRVDEGLSDLERSLKIWRRTGSKDVAVEGIERFFGLIPRQKKK